MYIFPLKYPVIDMCNQNHPFRDWSVTKEFQRGRQASKTNVLKLLRKC